MARIPRKFQKIFASDANNNGVFGSKADGTGVLSNDIETIQGNDAYPEGWNEAVLGTRKFPALEEFQSLHYMTTTQIAYIFQEGIPEYNVATEYHQRSIVKKSGTYEIYGSKIDTNIGNPLTDTDSWEFLTDFTASFGQATETAQGIAELATAEEVRIGTDDERIVTPLKLNPYKPPTGLVSAYAFSTAPAGWVFASNLTIGNAASGATNRANADTVDLFIGLWNEYDNTELPIQNSSGTATTRGASAQADFDANKRLPTLDIRGRVIAGLDNMGGTPAGRLSGQPGGVNGLGIGNVGGAETNTLSLSNFPLLRIFINYFQGDSSQLTGSGQVGRSLITPSSGIAGSIGYSVSGTGNNTPTNNVQPTIILPYIIKL